MARLRGKATGLDCVTFNPSRDTDQDISSYETLTDGEAPQQQRLGLVVLAHSAAVEHAEVACAPPDERVLRPEPRLVERERLRVVLLGVLVPASTNDVPCKDLST